MLKTMQQLSKLGRRHWFQQKKKILDTSDVSETIDVQAVDNDSTGINLQAAKLAAESYADISYLIPFSLFTDKYRLQFIVMNLMHFLSKLFGLNKTLYRLKSFITAFLKQALFSKKIVLNYI